MSRKTAITMLCAVVSAAGLGLVLWFEDAFSAVTKTLFAVAFGAACLRLWLLNRSDAPDENPTDDRP